MGWLTAMTTISLMACLMIPADGLEGSLIVGSMVGRTKRQNEGWRRVKHPAGARGCPVLMDCLLFTLATKSKLPGCDPPGQHPDNVRTPYQWKLHIYWTEYDYKCLTMSLRSCCFIYHSILQVHQIVLQALIVTRSPRLIKNKKVSIFLNVS